jgi:NADH-quinone oxidoreductase subunit J
MELIVFYGFASLCVFGALVVLLARDLLYNALGLLLSLLALAGIYVLAGGEFVAVAQIMVYVGGILVLLLFGVMFAKSRQEGPMQVGMGRKGQAAVLGGLLLAALWHAISQSALPDAPAAMAGSTEALGASLLTVHVLPFEAAGILLLGALLGALGLVKGKRV